MPRMPRQHYIPAALIGGFGELSASGEVRDAIVGVLDKQSGRIFTQKAENVGWERGTYRVHSLPTGDRDAIDKLWARYEPRLPHAVAALGARKPSDGDLDALQLHITSAAVRIPGFPKLLMGWHQMQGTEITEDQARASRLEWLNSSRPMEEWFWRALHAPSDVKAPFMLSDAGFAKFPEARDSDRELLFLPLSPQVGLLGSKSRPNARPGLANLDHREATITGTDYLNALGLLDPQSSQLFTHPNRVRRLEQIVADPPTLGDYRIPGGPYRNTNEWWL